MAQYVKLYEKSEIEYITPFLKLWMSFNNWYKATLPKLRTDRDAINEFKTNGKIKTEFNRLLKGRSNIDEKFQDALAQFVKTINENTFPQIEYPNDLFSQNPSKTTITRNSLVYISPNIKEFYYSDSDENRLFEFTLENIYQARCKLVHGDFDIQDSNFIDLIENSYRILQPIIFKIVQSEGN